MKAFIFDPLWDELITDDLLVKLKTNGIEPIVTKKVAPLSDCKTLFEGDEDRLLCLNPDYVGWNLKSQDYQDIPHLKGIFAESTGFEWVEPEAANKLGIPICNIKAFNTQAVAEWAITMMFNLARQTPKLIKDGFPLDFDKDFMKYRGVQLKGKTAGIIGLGNIGSAIAERCAGLGMNVVYWSRSSTNDAYQKMTLEEVLATADVILPATAKNDETVSLVSDDMLRTIKKGAIVVDIVHAIFNHQLLLDMVANGDIYGYGFEGEPQEFAKFKGNVWAAPAYAWATYESMYNSVVKLVENIVSASKNEFPNRVN
ncbi:MAG: NAD(P)-dependent oxidoreductase [Candidatus Saccharimonadales bacterium]